MTSEKHHRLEAEWAGESALSPSELARPSRQAGSSSGGYEQVTFRAARAKRPPLTARGIAIRVAIVLVATLTVLFSAALAWAAVLDYQSRGRVPDGVAVVGHDLSGMTESQARAVIEQAVEAPMMQPVTVTGDNATWTLDPRGVVRVDVESMLRAAYSSVPPETITSRLINRFAERPAAYVKPTYSIDSRAVALWVGRRARQIDRKPASATRRVVKYAFVIKPEVLGAKVMRSMAVRRIDRALTLDAALAPRSRVVSLPITFQKPKVRQSSFRIAVIVSLSRTRIFLYNGANLVKTYRCARGQPAYPTPMGDFKVETKRANAPWINPGTPWAASMPAYIPPGPDNPMGVRKIGIDSPGVFFHGVPPGEFDSIGTAASHACIRMMPGDVLDLYGRVKIGTPVFIRR